jgi:DNA-binding transcriptional LysR family regulator
VPAGVSTRVIAVEYLVVALPIDHPARSLPELRMSDLRHDRWITLPSTLGSVLIGHLRRLAAGAGFVPDVVQEGPDTWALIALVEAGVGCTLTLSSVAENLTNDRVMFLPLADAPEPVEVRMAWRDDSDNSALQPLLRLTDEFLPTLPNP